MFWSNRKKDKVELKYIYISFRLKPIGFSQEKFKALLEKANVCLIEECADNLNDNNNFVLQLRVYTPVTNRRALLKQLKKHKDMIDVKTITEGSYDYATGSGDTFMHIWGHGFSDRGHQLQYVKQGLSWLT